MTTTANSTEILRGLTTVPRNKPDADASRAAITRTNMNIGQLEMWTCGACTDAWTTTTIGNTMSAARIAWMAPATIFSAATAQTGMGASTRSSISLVNDSSVTSGSATAWMPWKFMDMATRPGTRTVAKEIPTGTAEAKGLPPPGPILGST